jgi:hypothetical protein
MHIFWTTWTQDIEKRHSFFFVGYNLSDTVYQPNVHDESNMQPAYGMERNWS